MPTDPLSVIETVTTSPTDSIANPRMSKPTATLATVAGAKAVADLTVVLRERRQSQQISEDARRRDLRTGAWSSDNQGLCVVAHRLKTQLCCHRLSDLRKHDRRRTRAILPTSGRLTRPRLHSAAPGPVLVQRAATRPSGDHVRRVDSEILPLRPSAAPQGPGFRVST